MQSKLSPAKPLSEQTPVEIDTCLCSLQYDLSGLTHRARHLRDLAALDPVQVKRRGIDLADVDRQMVENERKQQEILPEITARHSEYTRRGGWTRAFLVVNKSVGHVHRSRDCSTCYPTTVFHWQTRYSGMAEEKIVEAAGERACTVCYPTAPVDTRQRPTAMWTEQELAAKLQRETQRAKSAEKKEAKGITAPDGSPLRMPVGPGQDPRHGMRVETLWMAQYEAKRALGDLIERSTEPRPNWMRDWSEEELAAQVTEKEAIVKVMVAAIAHKQQRTEEEVRSELNDKAKQKFNKERKEAGRFASF